MKEIEIREKRKFDKVIVSSSPFIRTMTTGALICERIGVKEISLDYNFCEWQTPEIFKDNNPPLPMLEVRNHSLEELENIYML